MDSLAHVERIQCTDSFPVKRQALVPTLGDYDRLYQQSIQSPGQFWLKVAQEFHWHTPLPTNPADIFNYNFNVKNGPIKTEFLKGVKTNICYNLLDRIIERGFGDRIAYYW